MGPVRAWLCLAVLASIVLAGLVLASGAAVPEAAGGPTVAWAAGLGEGGSAGPPGCSAREVPVPEPPFPDLAGHWAQEEAELLLEVGVFAGAGEGFLPDAPLTRGQAAAVLARVSLLLDPGRLSSRGTVPAEFADVPSGHWAHSFVRRVVELGIMRGEGGLFHPDRPLSRQELAVLVIRVLGLERDAASRSGAELPFADGREVASWARGAVALAAERGLVQGLPGGVFAPREPVTRGQAARLVVRLGRRLTVPGFEEAEVEGRLELSGLEGCHFELLTPDDRYVLLPSHRGVKERMESLVGRTVIVRGRIRRGSDIYMRGPVMRVFNIREP